MVGGSQIQQEWFEVREVEPGVFDIWEPFHVERVHSHLILGSQQALLIDTGMGIGNIRAVVSDLTDLPVQVVNSHAHWDHIGGNWWFDRIAIHQAEAEDLRAGVTNERMQREFAPEHLTGPLPTGVSMEMLEIKPSAATEILVGGEVFDLGEVQVRVEHAPGHSPGGIVLIDEVRGILFSTDVAYPSHLYCISDHSDLATYIETMNELAELTSGLRICYGSHDGSTFAPTLLPPMRDALIAVQSGRTADSEYQGDFIHQFDGFGVRISPEKLP